MAALGSFYSCRGSLRGVGVGGGGYWLSLVIAFERYFLRSSNDFGQIRWLDKDRRHLCHFLLWEAFVTQTAILPQSKKHIPRPPLFSIFLHPSKYLKNIAVSHRCWIIDHVFPTVWSWHADTWVHMFISTLSCFHQCQGWRNMFAQVYAWLVYESFSYFEVTSGDKRLSSWLSSWFWMKKSC